MPATTALFDSGPAASGGGAAALRGAGASSSEAAARLRVFDLPDRALSSRSSSEPLAGPFFSGSGAAAAAAGAALPLPVSADAPPFLSLPPPLPGFFSWLAPLSCLAPSPAAFAGSPPGSPSRGGNLSSGIAGAPGEAPALGATATAVGGGAGAGTGTCT